MKNIVFFGTGAVAAEYTSYIEDSDWGKDAELVIKGYITTDESGIEGWNNYKLEKPFLGVWKDYVIEENDYFVLAFSNPKAKRFLIQDICARNGKFLNLIHPTAIIARTVKIGIGNLIGPYVMVGPNVILGDFNLLTSQTIISHDSIIGDCNFFSTSIICGHTKVGNDNFWGVKSTTVPNITIGNRNTIQAGMIVDKNTGDDTTIFYRFKEKVLAIPFNS